MCKHKLTHSVSWNLQYDYRHTVIAPSHWTSVSRVANFQAIDSDGQRRGSAVNTEQISPLRWQGRVSSCRWRSVRMKDMKANHPRHTIRVYVHRHLRWGSGVFHDSVGKRTIQVVVADGIIFIDLIRTFRLASRKCWNSICGIIPLHRRTTRRC